MHVVHLTASTLYGGPERQMLGLAEELAPDVATTLVSFREGGRCAEFLREGALRGLDVVELASDTPRLRAAVREVTVILAAREADVLFCHGYKSNLIGRVAARRIGIPAVAVSRGWTGESWKVRAYEVLDRRHLRYMDHVVCVSDGQATKVLRTGVPESQVTVIRNSARFEDFDAPDQTVRSQLKSGIADPVLRVVLAAGRLSPEKGFDVLVEAAALVLEADPTTGFVLFGDGPERQRLEHRVAELGIGQRFRMPGFSRELDRLLPTADLVVLPSHTEGLPNVALEASAAAVPVVATAVGGTPEVIADGETGYLVPPADPSALANAILALIHDEPTRQRMGRAARERMQELFSFARQAAEYRQLLDTLCPRVRAVAA